MSTNEELIAEARGYVQSLRRSGIRSDPLITRLADALDSLPRQVQTVEELDAN